MSNARILVAALTLSAAGLIGYASSEGWTDTATIPTQGDVPTVGFGSTVHADGTPVKLGEKITPVRGLILMGDHIAKDEAVFRASVPGIALHQAEYDLYLNFMYQYGRRNWTASSMRQDLVVGNYWRACHDLLEYRKAAGYDCSTRIDGQPNKRCWGVWTRQLDRYTKCMGAQ